MPACMRWCLCAFKHVCGCVCLWSWGINLLTGSVSGGGQWRFWDRHKRRVSERGRAKEGLFHVTLHSTKAQAGRGTRRDMRPPSSLPLPLPPTAPALPLSPPLPIQSSPLLSASDLNIYQRTPRWNSSSASVSWWESQTHTYMTQTQIKVHTHTLSQNNLFWILWRCGGVVLAVPWAKEVGLDTHTYIHTHTERHGHMLAHTFSPPSCFFIVSPVTLSYSFNLSLEPADSPVCVCTASGTMPKKAPLSQLLDSSGPLLPRQLNIKRGRVKEGQQDEGRKGQGRKRGCMVEAAAQLLWWRILLTCQGHVPHIDSRLVSDWARKQILVTTENRDTHRETRRGQAWCDCLVQAAPWSS